jgi:tRNA modification GTPase
VVRVSGARAIELVTGMVARALPDRQLVRAVARDLDGARLDDVLAVAMRAPRSLTGEDVAELHGHGGSVNAGRLLRAVLARGARLAEPGEFSRRAVAAGKLDLAEAEGLLGVIEAASERAWRVAQAQLGGALGTKIAEVRATVTAALAELEAWVDFPEEGLDGLGGPALVAGLEAAAAECEALAGTFRLGRVLRDGLEVALVGPVNAGKSSLFNALVGRERALVSASPGTTRDYVEARVEWDGVAVTLIDTAGERAAGDPLEERGIELGRARARDADVRVWIDEAGHGPPGALIVRSKADLGGEIPAGAIATSVPTGAGLPELRAAILASVGAAGDADDAVVVTSERQRGLLELAATSLRAAVTSLRGGAAVELAAVDVREGLTALGAITGEAVGEDVLDALFARFCIGK